MHNTLAASDYALIDQDTLAPRPNYWAAVLWRKLMDRTVLAAPATSAPGLRLYAHCLRGAPGGVALLALNTGDSPQPLATGQSAEAWVMTAAAPDAKAVQVNGREPSLDATGKLRALDAVTTPAELQSPPRSIAFVAASGGESGLSLRPVVKVVMVGEGMLELSGDTTGGWRLGHGGDTLNVSIHLARQGIATSFLTALGRDDFSARLRRDWAAEELDVSLVLTHPTRIAGLYAISTDTRGERSFTYWRNDSAARDPLGLSGAEAASDGRSSRVLGFSLISLAILSPPARVRLLEAAQHVRARGGQVLLDRTGNYRPRLWDGVAAARAARDAAIACADIGLPTLDDETLLDDAADAAAVARHWSALGCRETVVKLGAGGCHLPTVR